MNKVSFLGKGAAKSSLLPFIVSMLIMVASSAMAQNVPAIGNPPQGAAAAKQSASQTIMPSINDVNDNSVQVTTITINPNADPEVKKQFYERSGGQDTMTLYYDQQGNPISTEDALDRMAKAEEASRKLIGISEDNRTK